MEQQDYVYYAPVRLSKHALYSTELANLLHKRFGWGTFCDGKGVPEYLVRNFIKTAEAHDERVQTTLFYNARGGLRRVYLYGEEYMEELNRLLVSVEEEQEGYYSSEITVGKTKYAVYRRKK